MKKLTPDQQFADLTPDHILDAVESIGYESNGQLLALNSYENRVYRVGMEAGPAVIAKFYRPGRWTDDCILEEHQFTTELSDNEIPVIAPLVNPQGKSLFLEGKYRFALYPNHGGRAPELDNPEQLEQLGRFIGRIHLAGVARSYKYRPTITLQAYAVEPRRFLLDEHFLPEHLIAAYSSLTSDLIIQISQCFDRAGDVDFIRLHGDFHPGNVLWTDAGPHIVDFDDARMGPAIQDLWMFISGDRNYSTARLADLLDGYTRFMDFNPAELHLIEALRTMRMIHYAAWLAQRWEDPAFPLAFPDFNTINYWENHVLSLREQAAAMQEPPLYWD